jgi:hypothetical protein
MEEVIGKMSKEQYFEWRFKLAEVEKSKKDKTIFELRLALKEREIEHEKLRLSLMKTNSQHIYQNHDESTKQYEDFLNNLEKETGISIKDCIIDEYTYEIKKLNS